MRNKRNKIVFGSIIMLVIVFIVAYSMMLLQGEESPEIDTKKIPVPELKDQQKEYKTKIEAIDDLKEVQQRNAPSIYDEKLLDSNGVYDPNHLEKEKRRIIDSIYNQGKINYDQRSYRKRNKKREKTETIKKAETHAGTQDIYKAAGQHFKQAHTNFFTKGKEGDQKNNHQGKFKIKLKKMGKAIPVVIDGDQTVKIHSRLRMRLIRDAEINHKILPKNTYLYGFVSFKPNRVMIHITNINHKPVSLKAYDLQDGNEGIYVVNNFKIEVSKAIVDDVVDQINIPGVPSVEVFKNVFQRSAKKTKVTIANNYKLLLKPEL